MNYLLDKIKNYINDITHNVKKIFSLKDDLDIIIEREYKKAIKNLQKFGIIEYIKRKYRIDYEKPELIILEGDSPFIGAYTEIFNYIEISKESVERNIDYQLEFLGHKEEIERSINYQLKDLGYKEIKESISNIQDLEYLIKSYNSIFFYPAYINKKNEKTIKESIAKFIILLVMYHEFWHFIDDSILRKLVEDPNISIDYILTNIDYLFITSKDLELRASAFEVLMYYLANGFYKDERAYKPVYANILKCRKYIEEIDKLEKDEYKSIRVPYDLGLCYGNIIVAKYKSSLEENIYNIIDDIIHLNKERAIDEIKLYGDNLEWILHDKNSDTVI
jgi:hypothetical protein